MIKADKVKYQITVHDMHIEIEINGVFDYVLFDKMIELITDTRNETLEEEKENKDES